MKLKRFISLCIRGLTMPIKETNLPDQTILAEKKFIKREVKDEKS